ncbi:MAG: PLD nuclease N-terminal domain-containing protein [Gammaproteobacteria bacterium]|jgi:hypothetical protein|nr:PLD nuclease N-terminal domain-containing protein [Gammaproteobacteria bacterium]
MLEGIIGLLLLIAAVYAIIQVAGSSATPLAKTLWIVAILLVPVIGLIAWYFAGPGGQKG